MLYSEHSESSFCTYYLLIYLPHEPTSGLLRTVREMTSPLKLFGRKLKRAFNFYRNNPLENICRNAAKFKPVIHLL